MKYIILLKLLILCNVILSQDIVPYEGIKVFKSTSVYKLANAVKWNNSRRLKNLIRKKKINPNYQDSLWRKSILFYAVEKGKYKMVKVLLENGADPNLHNAWGRDVLTCHVSFPWSFNVNDTIFISLLLKFGANINSSCEHRSTKSQDYLPYKLANTSPLIEACDWCNLITIKYLLKNGANPNLWINNKGNCPLSEALKQKKMDIAKYLLIEKKVEIPPFCLIDFHNDSISVLKILRYATIPLGTEEHKLKMDIVDYLLKTYGLDYNKEPIPEFIRKIGFGSNYYNEY